MLLNKSNLNSTRTLFIYFCFITALCKKFATSSVVCNRNFGMTCCCHGAQSKIHEQNLHVDEYNAINHRIPSTLNRPQFSGSKTATLRPFYKVEEETGNIIKVSHPLFPTSLRHFPSFQTHKTKFLAPTKPSSHQPQQRQSPPAMLHNALPADATHALLIPLIVQAPPQPLDRPSLASSTTSSSRDSMANERNNNHKNRQQQERPSKCECEEEIASPKNSDEEKLGKNCCDRKRELCDKLIKSMNVKNSMEHFLKNFIAKNGNPAESTDVIDEHLVNSNQQNRDSFDSLMDRLAEISSKLDNWKHTMRAKFNLYDDPLMLATKKQQNQQQQQFPMLSFSSYKQKGNEIMPNGAKFENGINTSSTTTMIPYENSTNTNETSRTFGTLNRAVMDEKTTTTIATTSVNEKFISIQERLKNEFAALLGIVEENDRKNANIDDKDGITKQGDMSNMQPAADEEFNVQKQNSSQTTKFPDGKTVFSRWLKCKDRSKILSLCL